MKKKLFTLLLASAVCGLSYAQESNKLLNKLVEKNVLTESEANEIRLETKAEAESNKNEQATQALRTVFKSPLATIAGYGQLLYDYDNVRASKNDVSARCVYMSVDGTVSNQFKYLVFLEFTNPKLVEYWGEWTVDPAFNLRVGQYKAALSIEHLLSGSVIETVEYSRIVRNVLGYGQPGDVMKYQNGKANMGRDVGVQASGELFPMGDHKLLQYNAGIFQGAGMNSGDTNNNKDFAGSIYLQPTKGLRIGGAAYFGDASYIQDGGIASEGHVRNRWVATGEYKTDKMTLRSEYIRANDGGIKKDGLYGLALYQICPSLAILGKFDYYNNDKKNNTEVYDYTGGLRYQFFNQCTAMINYTYTDASKRWEALSNERSHQRVAVQLQVVF